MSGHTFTRDKLYELVWSEPMSKLAARLGISGTGLAKACRKAGIPVPERGYWNKLQAGHKVSKTPLPAARGNSSAVVTIHPSVPRPAPLPQPASVQAKVDAARRSGKPVAVPATLSNPHRIIAEWLDEDRRLRRERRGDPWFASRHKAIDETDLDKRRLRILSALFKGLEARSYRLVADERHYRQIQIVSGEEKLGVQLDERIRQVRRRLTDEDRSKRQFLSPKQEWTQDKLATGELVLKIAEQNRYGVSKEWREGSDGTPLEEKLDDILAQVAGLFEDLRLRRNRELEEQKRRWEREQERQRREMERKREAIRIRRLLGYSEDWRRAHDLRAFVAAVEGSAVATQQGEAFVAWKTWALAHAERLDPTERDGLFDQTVSDVDLYAFRD